MTHSFLVLLTLLFGGPPLKTTVLRDGSFNFVITFLGTCLCLFNCDSSCSSLPPVLVSYFCCNIITTHLGTEDNTSHLTVWEIRSLKGVLKGLSIMELPGENPTSCLFQLPEDCLHSLACHPFLLGPQKQQWSSIFKPLSLTHTHTHTPLSASGTTSSLSLTLLPPS